MHLNIIQDGSLGELEENAPQSQATFLENTFPLDSFNKKGKGVLRVSHSSQKF